MCLAVPAEVVELLGRKARVNIMGVEKEVSIALMDNVEVGDYLIIHAGCAISKVDKEEAIQTIDLFKELGENK